MPAFVARSASALPTTCGRRLVAAVLELRRELLVARRGAGQRLAVQVVDDLGRNVLVAAGHAQPRPLVRAASPLANAKRATLTLAGDFLVDVPWYLNADVEWSSSP